MRERDAKAKTERYTEEGKQNSEKIFKKGQIKGGRGARTAWHITRNLFSSGPSSSASSAFSGVCPSAIQSFGAIQDLSQVFKLPLLVSHADLRLLYADAIAAAASAVVLLCLPAAVCYLVMCRRNRLYGPWTKRMLILGRKGPTVALFFK